MSDEIILSLQELIKKNKTVFGEAIEASPSEASKKIKFFTRAILESMGVGDEESFALPAANGVRQMFIFRKLGKEEFSVRVK